MCIKVDNGKISVRVGGGFLRIDEFLDKYTTVELEKSLRDGIDPMGGDKCPLKRPDSPDARAKRLLHPVSPTAPALAGRKSPAPQSPRE